MVRVVEPPKELETRCPVCDALLAYTKLDIKVEHGRDYVISRIECPNCFNKIEVPKWDTTITEVKQP